jgi:alkylation response protein AidB-like acyl-CoA dehydrogenase
VSGVDLVARAQAAAPGLAGAAKATDGGGLSAATSDILAGIGLFRLGGARPRAADVAEALRHLARGCGASAFLAAAAHDGVARVPEAARAEVGARGQDPIIITASLAEEAECVWSGSGGTLRGRWRAMPGLGVADWVWLSGPDFSALVAPSDLIQVARTQLGGLRGVGWSDAVANDLAVPVTRIGPALEPLPGAGLRALALVLGTAEGAFEDYVRATRARISGIGGKAVATFTQVQVRVAESEAEMKAAAALWEGIVAAGDDAEAQRDAAYVARLCLGAVTRLVRQMGAMGLAETNPVQRRYRDLRTFAAAPELGYDEALAARGRAILGIDEAGAQAAA